MTSNYVNKYGVSCAGLADVFRTGFDDYMKMRVGMGLGEFDLSPANLQKTLETVPEETFVVKNDNGVLVLETAAPVTSTEAPQQKYIADMLVMREYMGSFQAKMPYSEENDEFITSPLSKTLSTSVGSVVFARANKRKPVKYLYASIAKFCDSLKGNVMIIGDPNCTINTRCSGRHWSTPVDDLFQVEEYKYAGDLRDRMIEYEHIEAFMNRVKIDHFVYCFSGDRILDYSDVKCHYLSLIAGTNGIKSCKVMGQFYLRGRLLTLSSFPVGTVVPHSLLCGISHDYDANILWYTDLMNIRKSSSLIPLSSSDMIGDLSDILISDKTDGVPMYLVVEDSKAKLSYGADPDVVVCEWATTWENQIVICELVGNLIMLCEPLVHPANLFGEWVRLKFPYFYIRFGDQDYRVKKKWWYQFPLDGNWQPMCASGEGIVLKNKLTVNGSYSMRYSKIDTYYLKLPDRVSYEDLVEFRNDQYIGVHNIYSDIYGEYVGPGIYEVLMKSRSIFRKRDKVRPDPHWYVIALANPPVFVFDSKLKQVKSSIFQYNVAECDYLPSDCGVLRLKNYTTTVKPGTIQEVKGSRSIVLNSELNKDLKIGDVVNYYGNKYVVVTNDKNGVFAHMNPRHVKWKKKYKKNEVQFESDDDSY